MTALHQRIANWDHEAHVLSVRRQLCAIDPLALDAIKRRVAVKRASVSYRGGVGRG